jgi:hypothetical protein
MMQMQQRKNSNLMMLAGIGLVIWIGILLSSSSSETGLPRWHPDKHRSDKAFW